VRARLAGALGLVFAAALAAGAWVVAAPRLIDAATARAVSIPGDPVAGRNVFFLAGCESCHMSPGQQDRFRLGGGLELKTPFGSFFPPNISPDSVDGIGKWSAADFADALLEGVSPSGEHYFPAFPYPSYRRMSVRDVRDLFAFLRTTPPVAGKAPRHAIRFPYSIRRAVGLWKLIYLPTIADPPEGDPSDLEALGRYIVQGPGHCSECHSPRDFLGGVIAGRRLTGGPLPDGKGKAPDITATGLADWSENDVADALATGFKPDGDTLGSAMASVVRSISQASDQDRAAIARYLKTYKPGGWR